MTLRASIAFSRTVPSYVQPMTGTGVGVGVGVFVAGEAAVAAESEPAADGTAAVEVHETAATRIATKAKRTPVPRGGGHTPTVDLSGGPFGADL
jgi:hypothetical protein